MGRFAAIACRNRGSALALAIALVTLQMAAPALASDRPRRHLGSGSEAILPAKPQLGQSKTDNPSHVVNEGDMARPLWIDTSRVAEFPLSGGADQPAIRPAEPGELSEGNRTSKPGAGTEKAADTETPNPAADVFANPASTTPLSPVFLDASGRPRALPGGVIVALKQGIPQTQALEQLQTAGLTPVRQIGERMWLVESPVGFASLELANRLHATGQFEFVQPNWWQPRTTK